MNASGDNILRCRDCAAVGLFRDPDFENEFGVRLVFLPEHPLEFATAYNDCLYEFYESAEHPEYTGYFTYYLNVCINEQADGSLVCTFGVNAA